MKMSRDYKGTRGRERGEVFIVKSQQKQVRLSFRKTQV
jgi:hypothetical protein